MRCRSQAVALFERIGSACVSAIRNLIRFGPGLTSVPDKTAIGGREPFEHRRNQALDRERLRKARLGGVNPGIGNEIAVDGRWQFQCQLDRLVIVVRPPRWEGSSGGKGGSRTVRTGG